MKLDEHEKESLQEFGKPFSEVHRFLDSYAGQFPGYNHRRLLHHRLGVELCVKQFGERARRVAEQHIFSDLGYLPEDWHEMERHYFPLSIEEDERMSRELKLLYGDRGTRNSIGE